MEVIRAGTGDDLVEDDVEDRRIAAFAEQRAARTDETRELESRHEDDPSADPPFWPAAPPFSAASLPSM